MDGGLCVVARCVTRKAKRMSCKFVINAPSLALLALALETVTQNMGTRKWAMAMAEYCMLSGPTDLTER